MLNKTTILQRVSISTVADRFMVNSRTDAIRRIPSVRGIEITPDLSSRLTGQTFNFAIIPSTAAGEIQANKSKDSDLIGDPLPKPSTKPSSGRDKTTTKQPNPPLNRTYSSVLRRPRNFSPVKVGLASKKRTEERVFFVRVFWSRKALVKGRRGRCGVGCGCRRLR